MDFNISDTWREQHPEIIGTTWSNGVKNETKKMRTRIDRILTDNRIRDRIIDLEIAHTKVSDHDAIEWTIAIEAKRKTTPYAKMHTDIIADKDFHNIVRKLYNKEKENGIDGYERFKVECVNSANKMKKKQTKEAKRNRDNIVKEIDEMRKIWRWAESANLQ